MDLSELKDRNKGDTVWVLGSGPSLNYVDAHFFAGKTVISANYSASSIGLTADYVFSHYHHVALDMMLEGSIAVTLERDTVTHKPWQSGGWDSVCLIPQDSYQAPGSSWNPFTRNPPRADSLVYGSSSLHGAMHLAAYLGAAHIVLVGADCGTIDDAHRVSSYPVDGHKPWTLYNAHHKLMKDWLAEKCGVTVYSLNPFINLNFEGHKFEGV